jgi:hypothetical protein
VDAVWQFHVVRVDAAGQLNSMLWPPRVLALSGQMVYDVF